MYIFCVSFVSDMHKSLSLKFSFDYPRTHFSMVPVCTLIHPPASIYNKTIALHTPLHFHLYRFKVTYRILVSLFLNFFSHTT